MHPIRKSKSTVDEKKRQICSPGMFFLIYDRATRRAKKKIDRQRSGRGAADFSISSIFFGAGKVFADRGRPRRFEL